MSEFRLALPRMALSLAVATVVLAAAGCASTASDGLTGQDQAMRSAQRTLTMQCYWRNEGARYVFGAVQVHEACASWARGRVRVSMPATDALTLH